MATPFKCRACGEPNEFEADAGLVKEQCVRCRSWNMAVFEGGAPASDVQFFPSDQPPDWKDGKARPCAECNGIVPIPEGQTDAKCPKCD